MRASDVIDAIREHLFKPKSHALLQQVRSTTSRMDNGRYADALVMSLWKSRGIWLAGIEVKVSRSDWMRELDNPHKADAIARYCDYWYVATPAGLVKPAELPAAWGLIEVNPDATKKRRARIASAATRASVTDAPDIGFLASILRNASEGQQNLLQSARAGGRAAAVAEIPTDVAALRDELQRKRDEVATLEAKTRQLEILLETIAKFERDAGLPPGTVRSNRWYGRITSGTEFRIAQQLGAMDPAVFRKLADDLQALRTKPLDDPAEPGASSAP